MSAIWLGLVPKYRNLTEYYINYLKLGYKSLCSMNAELQKLHQVWLLSRTDHLTVPPVIDFHELNNSIISTGPFYYYIVDFYDLSLSNVSPSVYDIHGFDPETLKFNDILDTIHPDDLDFVASAEALITKIFYGKIDRSKLTSYKMSYNFRSRMRDGSYALLNHQALLITLDEQGKTGKSLNIHTRVDHISNQNTYKVSLIGLNGEPTYLNMDPAEPVQRAIPFSKREIEVIRCIANGLSSIEIADKLFISELTVKQHRKNILIKSDCRNTAQLISHCIRQGLI